MKLASFQSKDRTCFGFQIGDGSLVDIRTAAQALFQRGLLAEPVSLLETLNLRSWLALGSDGRRTAEQIRELIETAHSTQGLGVHDRSDVQLLPPIPDPQKIICVGLNYRDHAEEQKAPLPEWPRLFAKFSSSLIGPDDVIRIPAISHQVDPEAELCVVIGERGRNFSTEQARRVIAGYTIGNDVSARDLQFADKQWVRGKSCDTFAPCGPFLVTPDEVGDPHSLNISLLKNGEVQQSSNTSNLIFDCYNLVAFISQAIRLEPGDLIFTGTPGGVGVFRDPPVFLKPGDELEVSIDKLGVLRNPVEAE